MIRHGERSRGGEVRLASALESVLRRRGLGELGGFARLERRWIEVVGEALAAGSRPSRLEGATLVVRAADAGTASELRIEAGELLSRARQVSGLELRELKIRVARDVL